MFRSALVWLGFASSPGENFHRHDHGDGGKHGHTHGIVDPTIATTERGIWAIKWSFVILGITAAFQLVVVLLSGSMALLADTIHNFGDAATGVPLWVAFLLVRRKPSARFTYGLGRVEDLAGVTIVGIILFSALVAGYQAIEHLINPEPIGLLGWVAAAGVFGFIGNEAVAVFRIRVGREIDSAALIADGYHARTDGLTSLAVVFGAVGVWFGFPLADPIVGLLITLAIFGIVWQSAKVIFTRMLDGVEPGLVDDIRHAAEHVTAVRSVLDVRARWVGHRLTADLDIAIDGNATVDEAEAVSAAVERELFGHIPALLAAHVRIRPDNSAAYAVLPSSHPPQNRVGGHHHAPAPLAVSGELSEGVLEIIETPEGERLRLTAVRLPTGAKVVAMIDRPGGRVETLALAPQAGKTRALMSTIAPAEPHEFDGRLQIRAGDREEILPFRMIEPVDHVH
ncbi:MAG: cation diffusion facilitator family transporter [Methylovirgula sp.]